MLKLMVKNYQRMITHLKKGCPVQNIVETMQTYASCLVRITFMVRDQIIIIIINVLIGRVSGQNTDSVEITSGTLG